MGFHQRPNFTWHGSSDMYANAPAGYFSSRHAHQSWLRPKKHPKKLKHRFDVVTRLATIVEID
jgi:hypothetical protein